MSVPVHQNKYPSISNLEEDVPGTRTLVLMDVIGHVMLVQVSTWY